MTSPSAYPVSGYGNMILNTSRMSAYDEALRQAVKPGNIVLDIGAGTGIFSLLACHYGAGHVYAIEPDPCIELARQMAAANGMTDRITFIQDISTRASMPERADILISDLHGALPLFQQHIPSIVDARKRLLKPGAVQIPIRDHIYVAPITSPKLYTHFAEPWKSGYAGMDMSAALQNTLNTYERQSVSDNTLLCAPQRWATLDFTTISDTNVKGELRWLVEQPGTLHALVMWFDAVTAEGIVMTCAPGAPETVYQQTIFPLLQPVNVEQGDSITVTIQANLITSDYLFRWNTTVQNRDDTHVKAQFKQSSFYALPVSMTDMHKRAADYAPTLNVDGEVDRAYLTLADGNTTLRNIAAQLLQHFPQRFATHKDALTYAGEMSQKYGSD